MLLLLLLLEVELLLVLLCRDLLDLRLVAWYLSEYLHCVAERIPVVASNSACGGVDASSTALAGTDRRVHLKGIIVVRERIGRLASIHCQSR